MNNSSIVTPFEYSSFYLNTPSRSPEQKNAHESFLKESLNELFKSVPGNQPTNILLWGSSGCGKTSFCASAINTVHIHSLTAEITNPAELNRPLDFTVTTTQIPNPIMQYPSSLCNLLEVNSNLAGDFENLKRTIDFLDKLNCTINTVCLFLDIKEIGDQKKLAKAFCWYKQATLLHKTAILILTKVDLLEHRSPDPLERPVALEKILTLLQNQGFPRVVPLINYRQGTDLASNPFTKRAIVDVLYQARFGRTLPLTPQAIENLARKKIEPLQLFAFVYVAIQLLKLRKGL